MGEHPYANIYQNPEVLKEKIKAGAVTYDVPYHCQAVSFKVVPWDAQCKSQKIVDMSIAAIKAAIVTERKKKDAMWDGMKLGDMQQAPGNFLKPFLSSFAPGGSVIDHAVAVKFPEVFAPVTIFGHTKEKASSELYEMPTLYFNVSGSRKLVIVDYKALVKELSAMRATPVDGDADGQKVQIGTQDVVDYLQRLTKEDADDLFAHKVYLWRIRAEENSCSMIPMGFFVCELPGEEAYGLKTSVALSTPNGIERVGAFLEGGGLNEEHAAMVRKLVESFSMKHPKVNPHSKSEGGISGQPKTLGAIKLEGGLKGGTTLPTLAAEVAADADSATRKTATADLEMDRDAATAALLAIEEEHEKMHKQVSRMEFDRKIAGRDAKQAEATAKDSEVALEKARALLAEAENDVASGGGQDSKLHVEKEQDRIRSITEQLQQKEHQRQFKAKYFAKIDAKCKEAEKLLVECSVQKKAAIDKKAKADLALQETISHDTPTLVGKVPESIASTGGAAHNAADSQSGQVNAAAGNEHIQPGSEVPLFPHRWQASWAVH